MRIFYLTLVFCAIAINSHSRHVSADFDEDRDLYRIAINDVSFDYDYVNKKIYIVKVSSSSFSKYLEELSDDINFKHLLNEGGFSFISKVNFTGVSISKDHFNGKRLKKELQKKVRFNRKGPIILLSPIIYSQDETKAFFFIQAANQEESLFETYCYFEKKDGQWSEVEYHTPYIF